MYFVSLPQSADLLLKCLGSTCLLLEDTVRAMYDRFDDLKSVSETEVTERLAQLTEKNDLCGADSSEYTLALEKFSALANNSASIIARRIIQDLDLNGAVRCLCTLFLRDYVLVGRISTPAGARANGIGCEISVSR